MGTGRLQFGHSKERVYKCTLHVSQHYHYLKYARRILLFHLFEIILHNQVCGHGFNSYVRHYRRVIMLNDGGIESTISIYFTMFHGKTHVISTGPWLQWQTVNVITISGRAGSVSGSGGSGCNGL